MKDAYFSQRLNELRALEGRYNEAGVKKNIEQILSRMNRAFRPVSEEQHQAFIDIGYIYNRIENKWFRLSEAYKKHQGELKASQETIYPPWQPIYRHAMEAHAASPSNNRKHSRKVDIMLLRYIGGLLQPVGQGVNILDKIKNGPDINKNPARHTMRVKQAELFIKRHARFDGIDISALDFSAYYDYAGAKGRNGFKLNEAQKKIKLLVAQGMFSTHTMQLFNSLAQRNPPSIENTMKTKGMTMREIYMRYALVRFYLRKEGVAKIPAIPAPKGLHNV